MAKKKAGNQRWGIRREIPRYQSLLISCSVFVFLIVAWWLAAHSALVSPLFLPTPEAVIQRVLRAWAEGTLLRDISISVYRVSAAFGLAAVMAIPLGMLAGSYPAVRAAALPLMEFSRYLPAVAFVPLILLWVGIEEGSKITIIWIGTFFQMVLMITEDVRRVPQAQLDTAMTLGARQGELLTLVILKSALPDIVSTLRITLGWAWTYLVVAELIAASSGLGYSILRAQKFLQTDTIFVGILMIGLLGLLMDQTFRLIHRALFPWQYH